MVQHVSDFISNCSFSMPYEMWKLIAFGLGFSAFESIWRRWFGGGFKNVIPFKWLDNRFLKHCINVIAMAAVLFFIHCLPLLPSLCLATFLQICFWTLTFGMYFDIGRAGTPKSEYDIKEYNKTWFAHVLNWFFPEGHRYTAFYDYCGMMIRFTWPLLPIVFVPTFNSGMLFIGPLVALAYGLGWTAFEKGHLQKVGPTGFGEFAAGAAFGWYLVTCGMM